MIFLYISLFANIVLAWICYNLTSKQERLEIIIDNNDQYFKTIHELVTEANEKLEQVKQEGMIGYDENIEWFYQYVKELQKPLTQVTQSSNYAE